MLRLCNTTLWAAPMKPGQSFIRSFIENWPDPHCSVLIPSECCEACHADYSELLRGATFPLHVIHPTLNTLASPELTSYRRHKHNTLLCTERASSKKIPECHPHCGWWLRNHGSAVCKLEVSCVLTSSRDPEVYQQQWCIKMSKISMTKWLSLNSSATFNNSSTIVLLM